MSVADRWLTSAQACWYLSVERDWLYDKVEKNEIPYAKVGRMLRFKQSELDEYMEERRVNE